MKESLIKDNLGVKISACFLLCILLFFFIFVYIDDILILSDNANLHLKHLDIFTDLCIKHGLALSEKKTSLLQEKTDFLGMKIDGNGIELQSHILEKITAFPNKLVDKKQVQSFRKLSLTV